MGEVRQLLSAHRLLTLTGGRGKSRPALRVAGELLGDHEAGVWLMELATLSEGISCPPMTS